MCLCVFVRETEKLVHCDGFGGENCSAKADNGDFIYAIVKFVEGVDQLIIELIEMI